MYNDELKRVQKKLDRLIDRKVFTGKNIYLFGVSDSTRQIIQILRKQQIDILAVIDNDKTKQGSYCCGRKVIPFDEIINRNDAHNLFLIYSSYWREMVGQLKDNNINRHKIICLYKKRKILLFHMLEAEKGRHIYHRLLAKYGDATVFVCPYTGTGDIYLIGTFWNQYLEKNKINHYVFVVITNACKKVAKLFDIQNIELLNKEVKYLISAHMLYPDHVHIKLLNDCWAQIHTNQIEWFRGYKGLMFMPLFRRYVFDLPDQERPKHPVYQGDDRQIEQIMQEKNLVEGSTIVLSPYSNTLADLPDLFWEELAGKVRDLGYCVCTNSGGSAEPAIKGTVSVFFPLDLAPRFVEKCGYFIGVRSGLCDVISGAKAAKIILYDAGNRFYQGSAFAYFNLRDMQLCEDAVELEFTRNNHDQILSVILQNIGERKDGKKSDPFNQ